MALFKMEVGVMLLLTVCVSNITANLAESSSLLIFNPDSCNPLVIAHRGASGYVPEHTLAAYSIAIMSGADYVEPDLVMTRDGHLIARHDNELSLTTDVGIRPQFARRYRTQSVDGKTISGWFTEDFSIEEIKSLRAIERIPQIRPGNARLDKAFTVPTMQEIIDLVKSLEISQRRKIGIYPEIKHPTHFQLLGLGMELPLVELLHRNGYVGPAAPAYIQSFEVSNLRQLKNITDLKLLQLYGSLTARPYDQQQLGTSMTYGDMATANGLREVSTYAYAVGPEKDYIITRNATNNLGTTTSFVRDAHSAGLKVHPYTFRAENSFLPVEFRSDDPSTDAIGDLAGEINAYLSTEVDGLFIDQPDIAVRLRRSC